MEHTVSHDKVRVWREQGLTVTIHRACKSCTAPGIFSSDEHIRNQWPGCFVDAGDERAGQSVGDRCPNCNASRSPGLISHLGEIWRKRFT